MPLSLAFEKEIASVINRHNVDSEVEIPDFVLASFVVASLNALDDADRNNRDWYWAGKELPEEGVVTPDA